MAELVVLELVQLFMARTPAPSGVFAGAAAMDLMRFSLVCKTDHTQRCQLRAVTWRLRAEQTVVASLQQTLDEAADAILDLEDHRDELHREVDDLTRNLRNIRLANGVTVPTLTRESVFQMH